MSFHLIIQYLIIMNFIYCNNSNQEDRIIMNDKCRKNINYKETYLDEAKNFLLELLRGIVPIKMEETTINNYDIKIIQKINKNIPCVYQFKNRNEFYFGAGININNLLSFNIWDIFDEKNKTFINDINNFEKILKEINNTNNISLSNQVFEYKFENIEEINKAIINHYIKQYVENKDNKYKSTFINSILSVFIQQYHGESEFKKYLSYNKISEISYYFEHLYETFPYVRLIQSKLASMMEENLNYNHKHIIFVIPLALFEQNEINKIKGAIQGLYYTITQNINSNNYNIISIFIYDEDIKQKKYLINFNNGKSKEFEQLFETINNNNTSTYLNFTNIYMDLTELFKKSQSNVYENKIALLFLNYSNNLKGEEKIIEKFKKTDNIQTIPVINVNNEKNRKDRKDKKDKFNFKYSIFYDFNNDINIIPLKVAINNMHINLDLTGEEPNDAIFKKKLENLSLTDIDSKLYFEVNINKNESDEKEYFEISLNINNTSGYNIFISDKNPLPSAKDNIICYIKYENIINPKLRLQSKYIDNKFYIGIEGKLDFNITIEKKSLKSENESIINEGIYEYRSFDFQIKFKDNHIDNLYTFNGNEYKPSSKVFENISKENLMKYFSRGIDLNNTDDNSFFNYNLFLYLFGGTHLINRVYKDEQNNYYIGRYLNLSEYTPSKLKYEEGFNTFLINKLYPFLNGNIIDGEAPSVYFNEEELKTVYNISYRTYTDELSIKIKKHPNCIHFEDQTPTMKFILFSIYFAYYYDLNIIKHIISLTLKEPKYSDMIKYLKEKKLDDNTFIINLISQVEQNSKSEKIMAKIIVGQSLILNDIGVKFVEQFYNAMSKSRTKVSLSIYDTIKNKINNIIPFSSLTNNKPDEILDYKNSHLNEIGNYKKIGSQDMDFNIIINFGLQRFSVYDNGIKKYIIIVCDENIYIKDQNYYINNKIINLNNLEHMKLIEDQIDLLIITSKNFEKGQIHELFNSNDLQKSSNFEIPYSLYENYFHVSDLNETEKYMNDLENEIKHSIIKTKVGQRFINDFNQGKMSYYQIYSQDIERRYVVLIKANHSNFNFYYSIDHPFPNNNTGIMITNIKDDIAVIFNEFQNETIYLGIEPLNTVQKQTIEIFNCESFNPDKNCKLVGDYRQQWYLFIAIIFLFSLFLVIYKCKREFNSDSEFKNKKRLNVFDM